MDLGFSVLYFFFRVGFGFLYVFVFWVVGVFFVVWLVPLLVPFSFQNWLTIGKGNYMPQSEVPVVQVIFSSSFLFFMFSDNCSEITHKSMED